MIGEFRQSGFQEGQGSRVGVADDQYSSVALGDMQRALPLMSYGFGVGVVIQEYIPPGGGQGEHAGGFGDT